jgi:hypothetical protein
VDQISLTGDWRIVVQSRDAKWDQRGSVLGALGGPQTLPGTPGAYLDVRGDEQTPWTFSIQHNDGSGWAPSDLAPGPVTVAGSS